MRFVSAYFFLSFTGFNCDYSCAIPSHARPRLSSVPVSYPEQRDKRRLFTLIVRYLGVAPVSNRLSNRAADLQDRKQDRAHVAGSIMPINLQYTPSRILPMNLAE